MLSIEIVIAVIGIVTCGSDILYQDVMIFRRCRCLRFGSGFRIGRVVRHFVVPCRNLNRSGYVCHSAVAEYDVMHVSATVYIGFQTETATGTFEGKVLVDDVVHV